MLLDLYNEVVHELLGEAISPSIIMQTLNKKLEVTIQYDIDTEADNSGIGRGDRIIQPVALGFTKKGNLAVRAYQPKGATTTYVPEWKIFLLKKIRSWKVNTTSFTPENRYNPQGDKTFKKTLYKL